MSYGCQDDAKKMIIVGRRRTTTDEDERRRTTTDDDERRRTTATMAQDIFLFGSLKPRETRKHENDLEEPCANKFNTECIANKQDATGVGDRV